MPKYRTTYIRSAGKYFIYQNGKTESIIKMLGNNIEEQRKLATEIVTLLNEKYTIKHKVHKFPSS
jgi:hypothetical protein